MPARQTGPTNRRVRPHLRLGTARFRAPLRLAGVRGPRTARPTPSGRFPARRQVPRPRRRQRRRRRTGLRRRDGLSVVTDRRRRRPDLRCSSASLFADQRSTRIARVRPTRTATDLQRIPGLARRICRRRVSGLCRPLRRYSIKHGVSRQWLKWFCEAGGLT